MEGMQVLGFAAGILTSGAMLPQLIKTWKTKEVEQLSVKTYIVYIVGFGMWITYGFLKSDVPIIVTNFFSVVQAAFMIFMKLKYDKK
jgi:MtN3 and saliva related transmembrane protein